MADIKVVVFGDGHSAESEHATTGYQLLFGGWLNNESWIGKLNLFDNAAVAQRRQPKVEMGRHYHWRIEHRGNVLTWWIDLPCASPGGAPGEAGTCDPATPFPVLHADPQPLTGDDHGYFGFVSWDSDATSFVNLMITPL